MVPEDQLLIDKYIRKRKNYQTDYLISTYILFEEFKNPEIAIDDNCIYIKGFMGGDEHFFAPLCEIQDFNDCMQKIISYFKKKDTQYIIVGIPYDYIKEFLKNTNIHPDEDFYENFGTIKTDEYILYNERIDAEYIYLPKNLVNLEGNKYRKIREKIHCFKKKYPNYVITEYNENDYDNMIELLIKWNEKKNHNYISDLERVKNIIDNKDKLNLNIYLLKVDGIIIGMTIIQILVNNVGVTLFEKSNSEYKYANYVLNSFEAEKFINCRAMSKQEDLGIEGLRQIKLSYKPYCFERKFHIYQYNEKEFFKLYKDVFGDSDGLINLVRNSDSFSQLISSFVLKNQKIISIGGCRKKQLRIFEEIEDIPFIFGIATKEEERRQGNASRVIKMILNKIDLNKYNLAMIAPEEEYLIKYYEKFGFVKFSYMKKIPIENLFKKNFDIKIGNINDLKEIVKMFNDYTKKYKISQHRNIKLFEQRLKEVFVDNSKLFILSRNNINYGYFIHDGDNIIEYVNIIENEPNENIDIIKNTLNNKNLDYILECKTINKPVSINENEEGTGSAYTLIRIISPENFVKNNLDYIFWENQEDFNKNIFVIDEINRNTTFNIKRINNKNYFSMLEDKKAENIEISIGDLMKFILKKLKYYLNMHNYIDCFYFIENW